MAEQKPIKHVHHPMILYQKLKASGNPQAIAQITISLLESHSIKETAKILGVSTRWIHKIAERFRLSNGDISACIKKRGPKSRMPNRTPEHIENLVVALAKETKWALKDWLYLLKIPLMLIFLLLLFET
nr:hypothetical protein [Thermosediminibacter oceani]